MATELREPPTNGACDHSSFSEAPACSEAQQRIESKTRRWGTTSKRTRARAAASQLGVVAPYFFYPLMHRYDDPANNFRSLVP